MRASAGGGSMSRTRGSSLTALAGLAALLLAIGMLAAPCAAMEGVSSVRVAGDRYSFYTVNFTSSLAALVGVDKDRMRFVSVRKGTDVEIVYSIQDNPANAS